MLSPAKLVVLFLGVVPSLALLFFTLSPHRRPETVDAMPNLPSSPDVGTNLKATAVEVPPPAAQQQQETGAAENYPAVSRSPVVDGHHLPPSAAALCEELWHPSPRPKRPLWRTNSMRLYFKYQVFYGFMNQHGGHLQGLDMAERVQADVLMAPRATSKHVAHKLFDIRSCVNLSHVYDVPHLRRGLKAAYGMDLIVEDTCRDADEKKSNVWAKQIAANTALIPGSTHNFTLTYEGKAPHEEQLAHMFGNKSTCEALHANFTEAARVGARFDVILFAPYPYQSFHRNLSHSYVLPSEDVERMRRAMRHWVLAPRLMRIKEQLLAGLRNWSSSWTVYHLRAEGDNMWDHPVAQVKFFHGVKRRLRMPEPVYLVSGLINFRRSAKQQREDYLDEERILKKAGGQKWTHAEALSSDFAGLSFEVAAAVNFFVAMEGDWLVTIAPSSWGMMQAQYRLVLRGNPRTVLMGLTGARLTWSHVLLMNSWLAAFCEYNSIRGCRARGNGTEAVE